MRRDEGIRRFGVAAFRIVFWTFGSRLLGLVRDRLMVAAFGRGAAMSAFHLAWVVPNLFRRLLGEGALTAAFVPVLTKQLDEHGVDVGRRSFAAVVGAVLLLLLGLVVCGAAVVLLLPSAWITRSGTSGADYAELLRTLLLVLLPYLLPVSLMTLAAAAQNVTGRFALPAAAPLVLNVVWVGGMLYLMQTDLPAGTKIVAIAGVVLFGGVCQLAVQLPGLHASGLLTWPRFDLRDASVRRVARNMAPVVVGLSVLQLNTLMTQVIAVYLVEATGANTILFLANRMFEFPHALLGVALGTAVFPLLSLLGGRGDEHGMRDALDRALSLGMFLAIPAAVGLFVLARPALTVLFVSGQFGVASAHEAAAVLRVLCFALPGLIAVQILARAHYALGDMRTPVRIAIALFVVAQVLNVTLAPIWGTRGLAFSSAFAATANAIGLMVALRRRALPGGTGRVRAAFVRAGIASLPTGLTALAGLALGERWVGQSDALLLRVLCHLVFPAVLGVGAFLVSVHLLRAKEWTEIVAALRSRRSRR